MCLDQEPRSETLCLTYQHEVLKVAIHLINQKNLVHPTVKIGSPEVIT